MIRLNIADYFTVANFACGLFAIFLSLRGNLVLASILVLAAVMFDFLDGRIARHTGKMTDFGKELDSLADLVSFGVWPAVAGFAAGLDSIWQILLLAFFSACGMLRLARFNVTKKKGFEGVPITTNGVIFPVIFVTFHYLGIVFSSWMLMLYALMGLLMISNIPIPKF